MSTYNPPRWADWLIDRLCAEHLKEEIQGDLHEAFHWRATEKGLLKARWLFIFEVLRSVRFSNLKLVNQLTRNTMMYKNYIKTGWRFIKKHKLYSGLNILGLSLGITFCWLAYLHANDETSFDKHLPDHDRMYRVVVDFIRGDDVHHIGGSSNAMTIQFAEKIPEIDGVARIKSSYGMIQKGEEVLGQSFLMADKTLIDYLDMEFVEGAAAEFDKPNDLILSESLAGKLNIRGKAVGEIITLIRGDEPADFIVRGVYKDIPQNTSIRRDMFISYSYYESIAEPRRLTQWFDINMNSVIKLRDVTTKAQVEEKMNVLHQENDPDSEDAKVILKLQPISQIHLNEDYGHYNGISRGGNTEMIRLFIGVGLFCLLISMINYSNFNISLYINRSREVALRKVVGAEKSGIFSQLITESFLSSVISGAIAFILLLLILPYFSDFVRKEYTIEYLFNIQFLLGALLILVAVAIISGVYPAFVLSRFSIIKSLKGEQKIKSGKVITQSLLGLQFVIATVLVAGMITMRNQIQYLTNFDTKIDYENVIYVDFIPGEENEIKVFMNELLQMPEVANASAISSYNGTRMNSENPFDVRHLRIDRDLISLLDIDVVEGRNLNANSTADQSINVLVNQALVAKMGLENPIGETLPFDYGDLKNPKVVGVVEDYMFESARNTVDPLIIYMAPAYPLQSVYFKLSSSDFNQEKFEEVWAKYFDPFPFDFSFLEDDYRNAYQAEQRMMRLLGTGCFVSIFLAAMGLLGIVALQLNQRLKEVSIRKILGASASNLYQVFTKKFISIILLGLTGGLVIGNFVINNWLESYPHHIEFDLGIVVVTIVITLVIAGATIVSQVFKVIRANPVKFLRDE